MHGSDSPGQLLDGRVHFDVLAQLFACVQIDHLEALARHHGHGRLNALGLALLHHRVHVVGPDAEVVDAEATHLLVGIHALGVRLDELKLHAAQLAQRAA